MFDSDLRRPVGCWKLYVLMSFRVLHLSDIHFSTKFDDEKIVHTDVRDQLLNDLQDVMVPRVGRIDKVLIAGDVAFSGKREEYQEAAGWLEKVTSISGCNRNDVLTVPGNHDVDRHRILPAVKLIHRRLRMCSLPEARHELMELAAQNDGFLTEKLTDYQAFASSYGSQFESPSLPRWEHLFQLGHGCILRFVGLTTVQICDAQDQKGGLFLGTNQFVIEREPRVEVVAIMHHPPEWLKDRQDAFQYLDSRARIHIFGHEHLQKIHVVNEINQDPRLVIGSGALTPEDARAPYIYRYNILDFALTNPEREPCLAVTIYPRVWIEEGTRFDADRDRLGDQTSATLSLGCPQFRLAEAALARRPDPQDAGTPREGEEQFSRINYLFWRYLKWPEQLKVLAEVDALPNPSGAPSVQVVARLGLARARTEGKLRQLWDRIILFVPDSEKKPNPFRKRKKK